MSSIHVFYTSSSSAGVHFSKAPASFQTRKLTQKAPGKHFVVFRKTRENFGAKKMVSFPPLIYRWSEAAKNIFEKSLSPKCLLQRQLCCHVTRKEVKEKELFYMACEEMKLSKDHCFPKELSG